MHLKTLTVRGFKSFASATTFEFEPGVTAVVGPNGSGKSNVVDALSWVMGEQGAKSLRGGSMEDVIFAGTSERQPLGRASVSLTIDNTDGLLPIEYSEVTISRTMFRTGGSEYTINGSSARLLDIQELLSDSGLGREMHVIVGQGQLDQILHATPEQRRGFIEEAAGVLKHRRRRERSVRKLENMQGKLERLEDLINEASRQLAPLGRQAKVARRAQRIQHDLRDALSRLIADDLVQAAGALAESSRGEESDTARAEELRTQIEAHDASMQRLTTQAEEARTAAEKLSAGHHQLAQAQERLRSAASLAGERAASLAASSVVDFSGSRDPEQLRTQAEQVAGEAAQKQTEAEEAAAELERRGTTRAEAEAALAAEETLITEQLRAAADRRTGLATLRGRVDAIDGRLEASQQRGDRARAQRRSDQGALEASAADLEQLRQRNEEADSSGAELEAAYEAARAAQGKHREDYEQARAAARQAEITVSERRARLSGLESALAAADHAVALNDQGAAFSVDVVRAGSDDGQLREALAEAVLVGDAAFGRELVDRGEFSAALTIGQAVIKDGERIRGGAGRAAEGTLTEQIEQLEVLIRQGQEELEAAEAAAAGSAETLSAAEQRTAEAQQAHQANEAAVASTGEQLRRLSAEVERARERIAESAQEIEDAEAAITELRAQRHELIERLEAAESDEVIEDPSTQERDRLSAGAADRRRHEVDARLALRAVEEQHRQLLERTASLRRQAQQEVQRREQVQRAAAAKAEKSQAAEEVRTEAEHAVDRIVAQLAAAQEAIDAAQALHRHLTASFEEVRASRHVQDAELQDVASRLHAAEVKQTELRLALEAAEARADEDLSLTPEYLIEHYGPDVPVPVPAEHEDEAEGPDGGGGRAYDRGEQEARLAQARKDLKSLGKVNPLALEEHAALEERHTYLQNQLTDLKKSRQDLLDIIRDVDATVEKVFAEAFADTKEQFERVFSRLFPGGEGRIELTNPEDLLNTGVEVHARPPGKRIRRLSLLSGGERSLTAVALLVAIFKARPSPFYVMDEVEAALDDTNLSRLLVIFEELRESSQLIVITHQRRTMEIADALYGVSMRQDGSTRVISQRLSR
ncbi:chromosome segregation SMC family protein [Nesterenkonia sp. NBAIMH1]|uniref:chromosome segregation SMC family protein n=1 Tax=Nesterenkonia sp. NBAIMH1 TaxID=2600320 RepID=UPI0011B62A76|nr:AAA family ATPase [Nesterenkonia sp. NBAIMH1]